VAVEAAVVAIAEIVAAGAVVGAGGVTGIKEDSPKGV
jgi:hypothetical protein